MKNQLRVWLAVLILIGIFSTAAFCIPFARNTVFWLAYGLGVFALLQLGLVFSDWFAARRSVKSRFYGFPLARVSLIYAALQLVLSLVTMGFSERIPLWLVILLSVLLFGMAAVGMIGIDAMREEIEREDEALRRDVSCMTTLRSIVYSLPSLCTDTAVKSALTELSDAFRYSDPVSSEALRSIESELQTLVDELQTAVSQGNAAAVSELCCQVSRTLQERNRLCKLNK